MFKKYKLFIFLISFICVIFSVLFNSDISSIGFPIKTNYILTSEFGYRDFDNSFHNGIDLAVPENTPVYAISSGIVTFSGFDESGGYMLIIEYNNEYKSMYCHLSPNLLVNRNDKVYNGKLVGYVGPKYLENGMLNGYTTGVHLHYTLYLNNKSINPFNVS